MLGLLLISNFFNPLRLHKFTEPDSLLFPHSNVCNELVKVGSAVSWFLSHTSKVRPLGMEGSEVSLFSRQRSIFRVLGIEGSQVRLFSSQLKFSSLVKYSSPRRLEMYSLDTFMIFVAFTSLVVM